MMSSLNAEHNAPMGIEGIDSRLEVLSEAPLVLATPINLLGHGPVTDKSVLFVRNIQDLDEAMTLDPLPIDGWRLELTGLITPSRVVISAEELLDMEQVEYEMVLQCSGNGRALYPGIPGTPWTQGGIGNVRFTGVPLAAVLAKHGVTVDSQVRFVTAEGRRGPLGGEFPDLEHSLPVADVLSTSILALQLNGEPLPAIHGGPLRLVTPGFFGTMQLKWLARLRFEVAESTSFYHATEYRVPLERIDPEEDFQFTLENSRPTWSIRLMSYILDPQPDAALPTGEVTVSGVAYNDGAARLESILVSVDRGLSWQSADFTVPESPYAWYAWSMQARFEPGEYEIWSRAIDDLGRTQPLDGNVDWNPNGYEWAGVFKTRITVT
ncbi:molybdopterin-dependent oxidoreductase [Rathayibacter soli]|uniref:molybdopterin-dependent oxidoreductase n=1 Tax=Rathayibacter soli TaxID=3144168 RepID=UPI0027E41752|nr:molybdopterin-dependent oxidoreductase [Glaciibacter superstes]